MRSKQSFTLRLSSQRGTGRVVARMVAAGVVAGLVGLIPTLAHAAKIQVGPTRTFKTLHDVKTIAAGDVIEVDGNVTYPGGVYIRASGTAAAPVTIRGVKVNGVRPKVSGSGAAGGPVEGLGFTVRADNVIVEGFDITASTSACFLHKGHNVTLRDSVVHDCPSHGLLSADDESGSLTLDTVEFHHSGQGDKRHQIYVAADETTHPGSVFRMQNCYVHDGNGGNNVKSRAERNEIRYNWIEGAYYHSIELIGPDAGEITAPREDGEVVGNVVIGNGSQKWHLVRIGGDEEETSTRGRYRFVNNTFVVQDKAASVIRIAFEAATLEFYNNVLYRSTGTGTTPFLGIGDQVGTTVYLGGTNWVGAGFSGIPAAITGTITGTDPGFENTAGKDFRLKSTSALIDKGTDAPATIASSPFPSPLAAPLFSPASSLVVYGSALARPVSGKRDIGAYEFGTASTGGGGNTPPGATPTNDAGVPSTSDGGVPPASTTPPGDPGSTGSNQNGDANGPGSQTYGASDPDGTGSADTASDAGGCSTTSRSSSTAGGALTLLIVVAASLRRRKAA